MSQQHHVVFGAGQIGSALARSLAGRGHRVTVVRRSDKAVGPGIEVVAADAADAEQAVRASVGADVIYHCMNASEYSARAWQAELMPMLDGLIAAAKAHDARLVCLDNVYAYGETTAARREDSPLAATGPKGLVRVAMQRRLEASGVRWASGKAGDFFGPGTGDQSLVSMSAVRGLGAGRPALLIGKVKEQHSFSWTHDVVQGLLTLGEAEADVEGRVWHLPVITVAPRELMRAMARAQGRRGWVLVLPGGLIRLLAGVVPLFGMLAEMLYQWEGPFLVDDSAFKARFPGSGATLDEAVRGTVGSLETAAPGVSGALSQSGASGAGRA